MKALIAVVLVVAPLLVSCAYNRPYRPVQGPEQLEYKHTMFDVYPNDARTNLTQLTNTVVAWAGIIRTTDVEETAPDQVKAVTTLDHHYFDWQEDRILGRQQLLVSPRGEGLVRMEWQCRKTPDASLADVENYAAPGKLAIVYGIPERVDTNTVVLKYHYIRVIDKDVHTDQFDYGRFGEPFTWIGK